MILSREITTSGQITDPKKDKIEIKLDPQILCPRLKLRVITFEMVIIEQAASEGLDLGL